MRATLTELEAPRCRVAAWRHWGLGTRVWGVGGERRLHTTSANKGRRQFRTLPEAEFLWLLLKHVLPRRFRRVRDFGLLHTIAKCLIQLLQLALHPPNPQGQLEVAELRRQEASVLRPPADSASQTNGSCVRRQSRPARTGPAPFTSNEP